MDNNISFSFNKVGFLLQRYFLENKRTELRTFLVAVILFFFLRAFEILPVYLFLIGGLYAARFFNNFYKPTNTMYYLLLPATVLEKIVSVFLLNTLYFFITTIAAYFVGNGLAYLIAISGILPAFLSISASDCFHIFDYSFKHTFELFYVLFTTQAIFTLGVVYFKGNNTFLKTILVWFVFGFIFTIIGSVILKYLLFEQIVILGDSVNINVLFDSSSPIWLNTVLQITLYLIAPFFWVVSYFRLKEKEV